MSNTNTEKKDIKLIIVNIISIALCCIFLPILILNCVLIVKTLVNPHDIPSIGGNIPLVITSPSMEDTIKAGDFIICKEVEINDIKVGDVICFYDPDGNGTTLVTHRVTKVVTDDETGKVYYRTQGDANNVEDLADVPSENVIGRWEEFRIGGLGSVILFTQSPVGLALCLIIPIGIVVIFEVIKRKKQNDSKDAELAALKAQLDALQTKNEEE